MGPKKKKVPTNTPASGTPAKKKTAPRQRNGQRKTVAKKTQAPSLQQDEPPTDAPQPQTHNNANDTDNDNDKADHDDGDDDDDDYSYEDTESDDGESLEDVERDELAYLLYDQDLVINNHQIPSLYYPSLKNRIYTTMRSVKIEHIYTALRCILVFTSLLLLLAQIGRMHTTVMENGYCNSRINDGGGTTALTTQLRIAGQSCIPCPVNGECINGDLFCRPLYRPHRSFMNKMVNLVWPTAQQCIRDPVMINYAAKMERKMRDYLSRRQGDRQCQDCNFTSTTFDKPARPATDPLVKTEATHMIETLRHSFGLPRAYNQNHQVELDHLADLALDMVKKNKHVMYWEIDGALYLGTDIAKYSFLCWCWVTLCDTPLLVKVSIPVMALGYTLLVVLYYSYQTWATKRKQVKVVTEKVLELLKAQRRKHLNDSRNHSPGCSTSYLRQHAMESTHENSIIIWNMVVAGLQKHPCLRHGYTDENGDLLQYFEWL